MPTTRSKKAPPISSRLEELCVRSSSPNRHAARYHGEQIHDNHEQLVARRRAEANPRPQGAEKVRAAAKRVAMHAEEEPLPTKEPVTLGACSKEWRATWCPTGFTPSMTDLNKRREYIQWRAALEEEAAEEVRAGEKEYIKKRNAMQRANAPQSVTGESLW